MKPVPFISNLDTVLLQLSPRDPFTLRDAVQAALAFGGLGAGKSSGFLATILAAYMRAGMGGVICIAKPEAIEEARALAQANGRRASLVMFDETQGFNFIDYALAYHGLDGIGAVTESLMRISEAADLAAGNANAGSASDPFWAQSMRQWINYAVPVIYSAYGRVTVSNIIDFTVSAATKTEQYADAEWSKKSYAALTLDKAIEDPAIALNEDYQREVVKYWVEQYPIIPEKVRGSIQISLSSKFDRFRHGRLKRCFCEKTTLVPEMMFHGAIIILCMPVLSWKEDGIIAQQLFLHAAERAIEGRNGLAKIHQLRPVFLSVDECQYFVTEKSEMFLSTCRSARACPIYLTQTLPTLYSRIGDSRKSTADGLIGKFATLVFLQNGCAQTNEYAAKVIGRDLQQRNTTSRGYGDSTSFGSNTGYNYSQGHSSSAGSSTGPGGSSFNSNSGSSVSSGGSWGDSVTRGFNNSWSEGSSETMDNIIEPNFFATALKSGGPRNRKEVTGVWFKAGASFHQGGGRNFMVATFKQ